MVLRAGRVRRGVAETRFVRRVIVIEHLRDFGFGINLAPCCRVDVRLNISAVSVSRASLHHFGVERLREMEFEFVRADLDDVDAYTCHSRVIGDVV